MSTKYSLFSLKLITLAEIKPLLSTGNEINEDKM